MPTYRIGRDIVTSNAPNLDACLRGIYGTKVRPLCTCRTPYPEMYLAQVSGKIVIKRMPGTGSQHAPSCDTYEPPAEVSGAAQVLGSAIVEDPEKGETTLRLDFSLSKVAGRQAPTPSGDTADTVKSSGNKLSLRAMLHFLWDEAGFTKWSPAMAGKRSWGVIRKYLLQAAAHKSSKGTSLSDVLFVPEAFSLERKEEINQRRLAHVMKFSSLQKTTRRLMLVIGELKEIAPARYGHKMVIKHLGDMPLIMNDDMFKRLNKRFELELGLWNAVDGVHPIVIGTVSVDQAGISTLEEVALMIVTDNWIPFESMLDKSLIDTLVVGNRRFVKGLRYNLQHNRPLATVVLSDTQPNPVAMYLVPPDTDDEFTSALDDLIDTSKLESWVWKPAEEAMPPIPTPAAFAKQSSAEAHELS